MMKPELESSKLSLKERLLKLLGLKKKEGIVHVSELSEWDIMTIVGPKFYFEEVIIPKFLSNFKKDER